ncbi:unnamed protein product, partial [Durusdinium trenchii]
MTTDLRSTAGATDVYDAPMPNPGDPRIQLAEFLESGDDRGPLGFLKQRNLEANENPTHWFAVFRPTSADAIEKMMTGQGTGKDLNIKGKSAKIGRLSGYVPVLQISENDHKKRLGTSPAEGRIRIYMAHEESCHRMQVRMQQVLIEMARGVAAAKSITRQHEAGYIPLSDEQLDRIHKALGME